MATSSTGPTRSQYVGCLIGECLGDALGRPVEGYDADACQQYIREALRRWVDGELPDLIDWSGQYTDDSQLARELRESLVTQRGWNPVDYADRIARMFREDRVVGRGIACDNAARRLNRGIAWDQAGDPAPSAGNGTIMRAAPIGLYYLRNRRELTTVAKEQGWITHHDPRCAAGSVGMALAVALILDDGAVDRPIDFLGRLAAAMEPYHAEFARLIEELWMWLDRPEAQARAHICGAGKAQGFEDGWPGISPFVIPSLLWSLYAFLRHPDSYVDAISAAIAVGGDVDTTAAMTGALSGTHLGIEGVPRALAMRVNDFGQWGYRELETLAEAAFVHAMADSPGRNG
ncbi:MAG TPA: ADP-ribosylglycohydrolase family protein [bacterium]|nr:ADP-ribosylglycohydrolase family protein [bacterium]